MNFKNIPIFIISYNRLTDLKKMVDKLTSDGYNNLIIVDNASDDENLLKYLHSLKCRVEFLDKNYGHKVVWKSQLFDDIINNGYYVVSDPDILPTPECPSDYVEFFWNILNQYPEVTKVGFSLKIDDLPVYNNNRMDIIRWESFFFDDVISIDPLLYRAEIDTTFALYRPGIINDFYSAIRVGAPYEARHLPWYWKTNIEDEEISNYLNKGNVFGNTYADIEKIKELKYKTIKRLYDNKSLGLSKWKLNIYKKYAGLHNELLVFGAGVEGQRVARILLDCGIRIKGFIVSEAPKDNEILGLKVYAFSDICEEIKKNHVGIILATTFKYKMEILNMLYSYGCTDICSIEM